MGCCSSKGAVADDVQVHSAYRTKSLGGAGSFSSQGKRSNISATSASGSIKHGTFGSIKHGTFKRHKSTVEPENGRAGPGGSSEAEGVALLSDSAVKVAAVVRPLLENEREKSAKACVSVQGASTVVLAPRVTQAGMAPADNDNNNFEMERAYLLNSVNVEQQLFAELIKPLADRFMAGFNATVFAYGQTGSGKTFTMGTAASSAQMAGPREHCGVIPRVINYIFTHLPALQANYSVTMAVEYIEVYADELRDLLRMSDTPRPSGGGIFIRESPTRGTYVENAERRVVTNEADVGRALEDGNARRAVGQHNMNDASSRSHALFTLHLEQRLLPNAPASAGHRFLRTKLHLVDLAGSERAKETGSAGQTFVEGVQINKGLSALGNVISALTEGSGRKHIPYRDSKLTRLLQDSLGGNSETVMLACVAPPMASREQSLNTLRYAARARNIRNKVHINKYSADEEIAALRAALAEKEELIKSLQQQLAGSHTPTKKSARQR